MNRLTIFAVLWMLFGGALAQAGDGPYQAPCGPTGCADGCCETRFYFQADVVYFDWARNGSDQVVGILVTDENNAPPGTPLLTTGSADVGVEPGVRFLLGWKRDECRAVEISFLGLFDGTGSATAFGPGNTNNNLAIPGDLGLASLDFFAADQLTITNRAELHNLEANLVRTTGEFAWLAGLRFISLDEEFNINGIDAHTGSSDYNIRANNDLYGTQIGGRWTRCCGCWGFDMTGKLGVFLNDASQNQFVTDFPPGFFLRDPIGGDTQRIAMVGDVQFNFTYALTNCLAFRIGYNLLWIDNVAIASDQLDFNDLADSGSGIQTGDVFLHGVHVGIECRW